MASPCGLHRQHDSSSTVGYSVFDGDGTTRLKDPWTIKREKLPVITVGEGLGSETESQT